MQHPRDEDPELQEVCPHLKVEPPRTWYYFISLNFCTLVILLQIDPLLVINLKLYVKVVTKLKTLLSSHGLQFLMLETTIGYAV
jgi:hypothetical protein